MGSRLWSDAQAMSDFVPPSPPQKKGKKILKGLVDLHTTSTISTQ